MKHFLLLFALLTTCAAPLPTLADDVSRARYEVTSVDALNIGGALVMRVCYATACDLLEPTRAPDGTATNDLYRFYQLVRYQLNLAGQTAYVAHDINKACLVVVPQYGIPTLAGCVKVIPFVTYL